MLCKGAVAFSSQHGQLKSRQPQFGDGKLRLRQGQGLASNPSLWGEREMSLPRWLPSPHQSLEGAQAQHTGLAVLTASTANILEHLRASVTPGAVRCWEEKVDPRRAWKKETRKEELEAGT